MRPASQRFFMHSCIYLRILIISYLATFLGTNSLSVPMCHKEVNKSINVARYSVHFFLIYVIYVVSVRYSHVYSGR